MAKSAVLRAEKPVGERAKALSGGAEAGASTPPAKGRKRPAPVPPARDTVRTRESILRHATKEFALRGFDGGRVDKIAARCRLSKNTLYYHFGSKDGLITAVLENMYKQLRERQEKQSTRPDDPAEALHRLILDTFQAFLDRPESIRLLNEENLHKARHLNPTWLRDLYDPLLENISQIVAQGIAENIFQESLDPVTIYLTISSLCYHFISNSQTLQIALGRDLSSAAAQGAWAAHISDVVLTYCQRTRGAPTGAA